jgi:gamma-glutamyltranspeptidase/glutathione hydrolase
MKGLLSKEYAKQRAQLIDPLKNNAAILPGDPYPFEGLTNPYIQLLKSRATEADSLQKRNFVPAHDSTATIQRSRRNAP